jgi:hypothetical protein
VSEDVSVTLGLGFSVQYSLSSSRILQRLVHYADALSLLLALAQPQNSYTSLSGLSLVVRIVIRFAKCGDSQNEIEVITLQLQKILYSAASGSSILTLIPAVPNIFKQKKIGLVQLPHSLHSTPAP